MCARHYNLATDKVFDCGFIRYFFQDENYSKNTNKTTESCGSNTQKKVFTIDELQTLSEIGNGQLWNFERSTVSGISELAAMSQDDDGSTSENGANYEERNLTR